MNSVDAAQARPALDDIAGRVFDVAVIGGGINGTHTAQTLVAQGYSVLLVEAQDFGSGASGRSGRLMHYGLRYLDRGEPLWNYFKNPGWFIRQCGRARDTMLHRAEMVRDMPERLIPYTMYVPVYRDDHVAPWQMSAGLRLINLISRCDLPVEWRRIPRDEWDKTPFVKECRDRGQLQAVFAITEHRYDWPERLVADYVLDAARMGAVCRNYTRLQKLERDSDGTLRLTLQDTLGDAAPITANARRVVNTAGAWIDQVLGASGLTATRQIAATKGVHAAVRLPARFRDQAFAHFTSGSYPYYFLPWRDLHYIGPTETHYEGDPADVRANDDDLDWLIVEANRMMPGLHLTRDDLVYHWAGVRPMPHIPGYKGKQNLVPEFHTHDAEGFPDLLSVPGGALMVHRKTGRRAAGIVARGLTPSGAPQAAQTGTRHLRADTNSPPLTEADPSVRLAHLVDVAREEMLVHLTDILLRRTGLLWTGTLTEANVSIAADTIGETMGWSEAEKRNEVAHCLSQLETHYHGT